MGKIINFKKTEKPSRSSGGFGKILEGQWTPKTPPSRLWCWGKLWMELLVVNVLAPSKQKWGCWTYISGASPMIQLESENWNMEMNKDGAKIFFTRSTNKYKYKLLYIDNILQYNYTKQSSYYNWNRWVFIDWNICMLDLLSTLSKTSFSIYTIKLSFIHWSSTRLRKLFFMILIAENDLSTVSLWH